MAYKDDVIAATNLDIPWQKLTNKNILITGATGLIGSCLVEILMSKTSIDYQVYVAARNIVRAQSLFKEFIGSLNFHLIKYDVMESLHCSHDFHYIIHAASEASPDAFVAKPVEVMRANIDGVCNLINYGIHHNIERFLYVSTGEVYGEGDGRIFTEDYSGYVNPAIPRSCYPSSKRASETLCVAYRAEYGVDTVIARPCHVYGPNFTNVDNRVYAQFIRNVLAGENIIMKSTGSQFRSWCYVVDCASALLYILLNGESGQAYNIADESSNITIKELADMIADIGGKEVVIELPSDAEKSGYNIVTKSVFSTQKLRSLGWSVSGTMKEKMICTIDYLK